MMHLCIYMFSLYTYSLLDLAQQPTNMTAAPSHLIEGDLFLYSASLLFLNLDFSNSLTLQTSSEF